VLVVIVVVVIHVVMLHVRTISPYMFELLAPLARLFAVLAVMLDGVFQVVFGLVNTPLAFFTAIVIGARG
jgi:hypothetical protein